MAMRRKGTGTWDASQERWEIRKLGIRKTPQQLAETLGKPVPNGKVASEPFWREFLAKLAKGDEERKRERSFFTRRLDSLDLIISSLKAEGRDAGVFETERNRVLGLTERDTVEEGDFPAIHPDAAGELAMIGRDTDIFTVQLFNAKVAKDEKPKDGTVRAEVDRYVQAKPGKDKFNQRSALAILVQVCGDKSITSLTIGDYRAFLEVLKKKEEWNATSKARNQGRVHTFLHAMETDYHYPMPWIGDRRYMLPLPEGRKEQYTPEQVRAALAAATGVERYALLCGLNFGMYLGDIASLREEKIKGQHVHWQREKLKGGATLVHLIWEETRAALILGVKKWTLNNVFSKFKSRHGFPGHKALRKTVAQMIQDHDDLGEEYALLYRGTVSGGTHHRNYIRAYTPAQVAKLDKALAIVRRVLFDPNATPATPTTAKTSPSL